MALTHNLNLTGRAASTQLREDREWIMEERLKYQREFMWKYGEALDQLRALDSEWSSWYDNQPQQTTKEMYPVILARVEELKETNELIQLARSIRLTMNDSIQTVQWNKAMYSLRMYEDSLAYAKIYKINPPTLPAKHINWVEWMKENARLYLKEARIFLNTEYTG